MPSRIFLALMEDDAIVPPKLTRPIPDDEPRSWYYHQSYPVSRPELDLVLASSERRSCHFAISTKLLSLRPGLFLPPARTKLQPWSESLPVVELNVPKEVIEILLICLDRHQTSNELSSYTFEHLVGALETAANYELFAVELVCLHALGAHYKQKPIHVFTLAENYGCHWMAELASEYTLGLNLTLPENRCLLSRESYDTLTELHTHRTKAARQILDSLQLPLTIHGPRCRPEELSEFWKSSIYRLRRTISISPAKLDLFDLFVIELATASQALSCRRCLRSLRRLAQQACDAFKLVKRSTHSGPSEPIN